MEQAGVSGRSLSSEAAEGGPGGLETEKGHTTIADPVVNKVAGLAAREVGGVYALGGTAARALGAVAQRLPVGDNTTQGVTVEVGEKEAAVDVTVVQQIRETVIRRIEGITGLRVTEVNVAVDDVHVPGEEPQGE